MENKAKTFSIAFEGMHRSGKGLQIELLKKKLQEACIPCFSIKGDGYREGSGKTEGDPKSKFWQEIKEKLLDKSAWEHWNVASYRLARELLVWRDRILKKEISRTLAPFGVLLIDRSLISRANLRNLEIKPSPKKIFSKEELYSQESLKGKKISVDMIIPDLILLLHSPKDVLLSRLDSSDPEFDFKKNNIQNQFNEYQEAVNQLPEEIRDRVVYVDSSKPPEEVFGDILSEIEKRFPEFRKIDSQK